MSIERNLSHSNFKLKKESSLLFALILTFTFFIVEVAGGLITGSLALISDAAHMLTDVTALAIAFFAIKIAQRPADPVRTFGYYRFEILAAAFNTILLFLVAIYILYEAYQRLNSPSEIQSLGMFIIAAIGLVVNLVSMRLLTVSHDKSLNMRSAYLEVWSDILGSLGVLIGAIIIYFSGWVWIDSLVAILIGLWILPRTWILLKESINVLLEGVPENIDLKKLKQALFTVDGVLDVHELHVWAITTDRISLTAHVIIDSKRDCETILIKLRRLLSQQFSITHTTFQHEKTHCSKESEKCDFIHS
ncbi:MAG: cation diffusion facilitator family transporter [Gammaproteobacteria bacterium]|nr:cation diffusion facilitator family transporter [Gammaproteobacteria bacterium]